MAFETTKKIKIGNKDITCMDLTYGYILNLETGSQEDTVVNAVENGTDMSMEDILALRKHEVENLYNAVMSLTYPHAYNEDGTLKVLPEVDTEDKKKA